MVIYNVLETEMQSRMWWALYFQASPTTDNTISCLPKKTYIKNKKEVAK